jgi:hypothetical protein
MKEHGILGVFVFTTIAGEKPSDVTTGEIMLTDSESQRCEAGN